MFFKIVAVTGLIVSLIAIIVFIIAPEFTRFKDTMTCYTVQSNVIANKKEYPDKLIQYCNKLINASFKKVEDKKTKKIKNLIEKLDDVRTEQPPLR